MTRSRNKSMLEFDQGLREKSEKFEKEKQGLIEQNKQLRKERDQVCLCSYLLSLCFSLPVVPFPKLVNTCTPRASCYRDNDSVANEDCNWGACTFHLNDSWTIIEAFLHSLIIPPLYMLCT